MALELTNIQERVERTFYEVIRKALVEFGYWPDITTFTNDQTGADSFNAAVAAIRTSKGYAIQPFGVGSSQAKGEKKTPRIVLVSKRTLPGDLGTHLREFQLNGDTYDLVSLPFTSSLLELDITIASATAAQDRKCNAILAACISTRKYLAFYDLPGDAEEPKERFFSEQINYRYYNDPNQGVQEKTFTYQVKDLYLTGKTLIQAGIAKISKISVVMNDDQGNFLDGINQDNDQFPYLYGLSNNPALSGTELYNVLSKDYTPQGDKVYDLIGTNVFIYFGMPEEYDDLTSIKDPNNFQLLPAPPIPSSFIQFNVNVTSSGLTTNWTHGYKIYRLKLLASATGQFKFIT